MAPQETPSRSLASVLATVYSNVCSAMSSVPVYAAWRACPASSKANCGPLAAFTGALNVTVNSIVSPTL